MRRKFAVNVNPKQKNLNDYGYNAISTIAQKISKRLLPLEAYPDRFVLSTLKRRKESEKQMKF